MAVAFKFPDVGEGITEGRLVRWLVNTGDTIAKDQSLCEVETDKAVVELPSPENGTVLKLYFKDGDTIHVGDVLVTIGEKGECGTAALKPLSAKQLPKQENVSAQAVPSQSARRESAGSPKVARRSARTKSGSAYEMALAMPHTRKLARMLGIDIAKVPATGPGGRVTDEDVRRFRDQSTPAVSFAPARHGGKTRETPHGFEEVLPLSGIRKTIAKKLSQSWRTAVHVSLMDEVEVSKLVKLRQREKERLAQHDIKLTFLPFIVKSVIVALERHPIFNSEIDVEKNEIRVKHFYNIGIAVDTEQGLMVPVIKNADQKSITEMAIEINELAVDARERKLALPDLQGSSFSITNYGSIGTRFGTPIINPPNTAILGVGRITERAIVRNGQIKVGQMMPLSFVFDHRVADGSAAAEFLAEVMRHLEDPGLLLVDSI